MKPEPFCSSPQVFMIGQSLRKTPMFADIDGVSLEVVARGCQLKSLAKGEVLFHEGQPVEGFYVVQSGALNVHRVTEDGREQVIRVFYPGETFGEVVLVGNQTYPAAAKAVQSSRVILVPAGFFRQQIEEQPDLALRLLGSMSLHLRYLVETIEDLKLRQAESRVAQWLLRQVEEKGSGANREWRVHLPLAKHLLASQLGITSETLSRVFARFRQNGCILVEGKTVRLLSTEGLREFKV